MDSSVKDKYIILGFIGFAILLISFIATLVVASQFNQDSFVRWIVFISGNLLGWLLYFSFQTLIFDTYEIYKIKFGKKETVAEAITVQEEAPTTQSVPEPATPVPIPTMGEATIPTKPIEIAITPDLHKKNRADYKNREQRENEKRIRMVMEYCHYYLPRIADEETVNHICAEVNEWMNLNSYTPKPITRRLIVDVNTIPLRHFVWNISERFLHKKYYNGDVRANFIKTLFPHEFADTDIATIKNFKVEPTKTLIPIDEPEDGNLAFHYPEDYVREVHD